MRVLMTIALVFGVASSAFAQQAPEVGVTASVEPTAVKQPDATPSGCWPVTSRDRVVVEMEQGPARTGTLLCMGPEEIMLTGSGTLPLSKVREIKKPRDSELDGALKGAAVGLLILALCAGECEANYVLRATLGYAALGATIDSLQGNEKVIYRREPRAAVGFRLRF